jgi:hypothetical protein
MQYRSPILFWLLLAATISLDLVVSSWIRLFGRTDHLELLILALVFGQLSAVSIWIVFSSRRAIHRWLAAVVAIPLAALAILHAEPPLGYTEAAALVATHFMASLLVLWLQRLIVAHQNRLAGSAQFSIRNLFGLTTAIALAAALLGGSKLLQQAWLATTILILNNVLMGVVALILWNRNWHWLLRLAATLAAAVFAGWCISIVRPHLSGKLEVMNCIQVLIVLAWLGIGEIIPRPIRADRDDEMASAST